MNFSADFEMGDVRYGRLAGASAVFATTVSAPSTGAMLLLLLSSASACRAFTGRFVRRLDEALPTADAGPLADGLFDAFAR